VARAAGCGSTLTPADLEARAVRQIAGASYDVDKFRCGCGRGREVRRRI
jgi:hypothetical protein